MYKDPPMELLDSRFNAVALKEFTSLPDVDFLGRKLRYTSAFWIEEYATTLNPDDKASVMIKLGALCLKIFKSIHADSASESPGLSVFFAEVARCWEAGIKGGRSEFSWMGIKWNIEWQNVYVSKALRHLSFAEDPRVPWEERIKHAAAVYCNANILWHHCGCNGEETDEDV